MTRFLIVVLFILPQTANPLPRQAVQDATHGGTPAANKRTNNQGKSISVPVQNSVNSTSRERDGQQKTSQDEQGHVVVDRLPDKDWWDKFYICLTATLVVIGGGTLGAIWYQAIQNRKSADAALMNVRGLITENRPWLLIQNDSEQGLMIQNPHLVPIEEDPSASARMAHCIFHIMNYGKTPARAIEEKAELQIGDSPTAPPDAAIYQSDSSRDNPLIFPQGVSLSIQAILAPLGFITLADRDALQAHGKFLWLCGFLRYSDTFSEGAAAIIHETRFCYLRETRMNTSPFWVATGPPEYNRAT